MDMTVQQKKEETATISIEPRLIIGLVPCYQHFYVQSAWEAIKEPVEELCKQTEEESRVYDIWRDIFYGNLHCYLGYLDRTGTAKPETFQPLLAEHLRKPKEDFVGYMLVRLTETSAHILQAHIEEQHKHTNIFDLAFDYVLENVKNLNAPYISFVGDRNRWGGMAQKLGFKETYTMYRRKL